MVILVRLLASELHTEAACAECTELKESKLGNRVRGEATAQAIVCKRFKPLLLEMLHIRMRPGSSAGRAIAL